MLAAISLVASLISVGVSWAIFPNEPATVTDDTSFDAAKFYETNTRANAARGAYTLLELPTRVENRPMPPVQVIDLRHEPKPQHGRPGAISPTNAPVSRNARAATSA